MTRGKEAQLEVEIGQLKSNEAELHTAIQRAQHEWRVRELKAEEAWEKFSHMEDLHETETRAREAAEADMVRAQEDLFHAHDFTITNFWALEAARIREEALRVGVTHLPCPGSGASCR